MQKILIVDDEDFVRDHLVRLIKRKGYEVLAVGDGESAIAVFKAERPGVVLLDIHLPKIDGEQVFDEMRKIDASANIYFMTGGETEINRLKEKSTPAAGYLLKPLEIEEILKVLGST